VLQSRSFLLLPPMIVSVDGNTNECLDLCQDNDGDTGIW